MFVVQSHEWITRKKTACGSVGNHREGDGIWTSSRGSLPKNLIAAHPVQGSLADEGFGGTCSPATPCAQRNGTGKTEGCGDVDSLGNGCGRRGLD